MIGSLPGLSTRIQEAVALTGARFGIQVFSASGTFTMPSGVSSVTAMVICIGGGGGGCGGNETSTSGTAGTAGGTTSFGSLASAAGGSRGVTGGTAQETDGYSLGSKGIRTGGFAMAIGDLAGGFSGQGFLGIGSGGRAGVSIVSGAADFFAPFGGNSGAVATYFGPVSANQTVTIGDGGAGGAGGAASGAAAPGQKGSPGAVIVFYWW